MADRPRNPYERMETATEFDLNTALRHWRERPRQSPHFRKENVAELEPHVRDSVAALQGTALSEKRPSWWRREGSAACLPWSRNSPR